MSPDRRSNNNILNNLKDHVDSGDVLFVVSGDAPKSLQAIEALNKRCMSKCHGRRKLNRDLHSKIIDASQFVAICDEPNCSETKSKGENEMILSTFSEKSIAKPEKTLKRKDNISNPSKTKSVGPPPVDKNWKRKIILRQMKNHRISTTAMCDASRQFRIIRPVEKLTVLQDIFDTFVNRQKLESASLDSENLTAIMNRVGFSKYGFKTANTSPYITNVNKSMKRKPRSVNVVPRHSCFTSENNRVPSYMGWYWTKSFSKFANCGWRPGAIPRNIRNIMSYFNGPCSCMPSDLKTCPTYNEKLEEAAGQIVARKPTLKVVRKDGLYYISMNPLKPSKELNRTQNPYLDDCPPIKFQIVLNQQYSDENDLGLLGYPCSERPAICDDNKEMQDLLQLLSEECENDNEFYKLAKTLCSKPSDLDIEFIAPGANLRDKSIYREEMYQETQYDKNDFDESFGKPVSRSLPAIALKKKKTAP